MNNRSLYLRWGGQRNRADDLARELGARLVSFKWRTKSPLVVPIRYGVQFAQTLGTLVRERPDVVITQHTQPFCSLAATLYTKVFGGELVTDCHNGPFVDRLWSRWPLAAINRYVYRSATINLVHNEGIRDFVEARYDHLGSFRVLHDPIPNLVAKRKRNANQVIAICSFHGDEPVEALLAGAALLPETNFLITGDTRRLSRETLARATANVSFTGFVPDEEYDDLLRSSAAAVALSTRDNVLMRACQEAIGSATPLVTSDRPIAREYLAKGTVFTDNAPDAIAEAVRYAVRHSQRLQQEMESLRQMRTTQWFGEVRELKRDLGL